MSTNKGKIGIVGSGLIGRSWSMLFASVGYPVSIFDIVPSQIQNALMDIQQQLNNLEKTGLLRGKLSAKEQYAFISGTNSLKECTEGAWFVLECVPEVFDIKRKALINADEAMDEGSILASSTSTTLPSKLSEGLKHKETFIVTHPVNPPYYVPLVELVPAPCTRPEVISKSKALMVEIGQKPVTMKKECIGFALNRIQFALLNECYNLIEDGVMSPEDVDIGMSEGVGRRYAFVGPLETCHLNAKGMKDYLSRYAETVFDVSREMGPLRKMDGATADVLCQSLTKRIPLKKLQEARKKRDNALLQLTKLRKDLPFKS